MNYKYSSRSNQKRNDFLTVLFILILINILIISGKLNIFYIIASFLLTLLLGYISYKQLYKKTFIILFHDDYFEIIYEEKDKTETFSYKDVLIYKYYAPYSSKSPDSNSIILNNCKYRFSPVAKNKDFINFCKWLKSKNELIEIKIEPSDDYLNHLYQEEFGFNYRK